jgi:lipopolysaccharide export LptBFGC system permease protein LptF
MSDPQPQPPDSGSRASLLGCLGAVMLLPGLCSLLFSFMFVRDIFTHGVAAVGPFPEILLLWVPSFLIAALGIALIRADRRN